MKGLKIFLLIIGIVISFVNDIGKGDLKNISDEDTIELMKVLKIESSSTFLPIKIEKIDCGLGDTTLCYKLIFEISKEEYEANKLKYKDKESVETVYDWKEKKDEKTYICYVRDFEWTSEHRKEVFEKLRELYNKY